jgi:Alanine dehydrogenase/PNT, N-terminal domain
MDGIRIANQQYPYSIDAHDRQRSERHCAGRTAGGLVPEFEEAGLEVAVQSGAGELAGFFDDGYAAKGARLEAEVFDKADILLKVQPPTQMRTESSFMWLISCIAGERFFRYEIAASTRKPPLARSAGASCDTLRCQQTTTRETACQSS